MVYYKNLVILGAGEEGILFLKKNEDGLFQIFKEDILCLKLYEQCLEAYYIKEIFLVFDNILVIYESTLQHVFFYDIKKKEQIYKLHIQNI